MTIDWTGLALFIVAAANAYIIVVGHYRDKKVEAVKVAVAEVAQKVEVVAVKTEETHKLVNGQSEKIEALVLEKGIKIGADAERANPTEKK